MDKTININISGILFHIDDEAFRVLRDYLQALNNRFLNVHGGPETIEDIESRIAEIFRSQKGLAGVITLENVEGMIAIIGKAEDFDQPDAIPEAPVYSEHRKRMYRNPDDTIISGVCGGIGAYLNTDPVLFRILFVIFAIFFGVGFFVYIALWIALPSASTDSRKREMYGNAYHSVMSHKRRTYGTCSTDAPTYNKGYYNTSGIGNAFNEVFRAIGRVFYIVLRIFLIILGIAFVLIGFLLILTFVMILVFKYPASYSASGFDMQLIYISDFLKFVVNPALVPWITGLTLAVLVLPMIALIYWGIKMIFWFRAKDAVFSLIGFILWIMIIAILAVILFNEGLSFADTAKSSNIKIFPQTSDTIYIKVGNRVSSQKIEKELSLRDNGYNIFINEDKKELYIRPYLKVYNSENETAKVELRKRSSGRNEVDAMKKTEELIYNFSLTGDTLILDEYFTIPPGRKWAADNVGINLYVPLGTILKMDKPLQRLLHIHKENEYYKANNSVDDEATEDVWILTADGIEPAGKPSPKQK